jgi:DNA repair protein RadC
MKSLTKEVAEIEVSYYPVVSRKPAINSAEDAFQELLPFFSPKTIALKENFVVMYLNRANRVLGIYKAFAGGITGTMVDLRMILSVALKTAATGIILAHNHPSGNLKPSQADIEITKRIAAGCLLLDIKLVDHLIITPDREYLSMAEEGVL